MFKDFFTWGAGVAVKGLFCGTVLLFGVPPIYNYLIKGIEKAMEREHKRNRLIAEQSYRYLMGETSIPSHEKYGR